MIEKEKLPITSLSPALGSLIPFVRAGKINYTFCGPKWPVWDPRFWPQNCPEKVYVGPLCAFFPRKWGTWAFFWGPQMGCFGWGAKRSLCWKSLCAFSAPYSEPPLSTPTSSSTGPALAKMLRLPPLPIGTFKSTLPRNMLMDSQVAGVSCQWRRTVSERGTISPRMLSTIPWDIRQGEWDGSRVPAAHVRDTSKKRGNSPFPLWEWDSLGDVTSDACDLPFVSKAAPICMT